jgi:hypothetical protein
LTSSWDKWWWSPSLPIKLKLPSARSTEDAEGDVDEEEEADDDEDDERSSSIGGKKEEDFRPSGTTLGALPPDFLAAT